MDVALALRSLWSRRWLVLLAVILSAAVGVVVAFRVQLSPFSLQSRGVEYAVGQSSVLVDAGASPLSDASRTITPLVQRAQIITSALGGADVRRQLARRTGIPLSDIAVGSLGTGGVRDPAADQRAAQIVDRGEKYQVTFRPTQGSPVIAISTQAPTAPEALSLATAAVAASRAYVERDVLGSPSRQNRIVLRPLEAPTAGVVNPNGAAQAAVVAGIATLMFLLFLILLLHRLRTDLARRREDEAADPTARADRQTAAHP